jgi:phage baseplate assembly protein W
MRHRALRFAGVGLSGTPIGLTVTATGSISMVDGDESVRQAIIMLLSTTPGERLMRPDYGSRLRRLAFAPNDQTTAGLAIHYVRQAIERWEPRVEIIDLDAEADPDEPTQLIIILRYRVRASLTAGTVEYPLSLSPRPTGPAAVAGATK